jgi:hypothetical protein
MDDNVFECPNCGAKIYPEMTRCPQCGREMYPEDEEDLLGVKTAAPVWITSLGAVVIGWLVASGIAILLNFILATLSSPTLLGAAGKLVLLLAGPLGAWVGSYVAAGIHHRHVWWLGALIGLLVLPVLALFATRWVENILAVLLNPWGIAWGVLTVLLGVLGAWMHYKLVQDTGWKEQWQVRGWEDLLYQDLLRKVRFNGSAVDRLIEYERRQNPNASRLQLIQNAIDHWEHDHQ